MSRPLETGPRPCVSVFELRSQRVVTGAGAAWRVSAEVARIGGERAMLVAGKGEAEQALRLVNDINVVATFTEVRPHVPVEVARAATDLARSSAADILIAVGGGSTVGTAKAVALTERLPVLGVPTTYAGSEATEVGGLTDQGRKTNGTDPVVLPRSVIYDPELTISLPASLTTSSGPNALAHGVDSLWGPTASPVSTALAVEGIRQLVEGLGVVVRHGRDLVAREQCQVGTYLEAAGYGDGSDAVAALASLYDALDAPRSLGTLGLDAEQVERAAVLALEKIPPSNPRLVSLDDLVGLLSRAQSGVAPVLVPLRDSGSDGA